MAETIFTANEQRNFDRLASKDSSWAMRIEIAKHLVELSKGDLRLAPQKGYIPLQPADGIRRNPRNAVSILSEGVSFVVSDWSAKDEASRLVSEVECGERTQFKNIKKLLFPKLQLSTIESNPEFFAKLVSDAKRIIIERSF
jgi:hypothetical protein